MLFDDVRQRYGAPIARRVSAALGAEPFETAAFDQLTELLERMAGTAYTEYLTLLHNPMADDETPAISKQAQLEILFQRWQEARELADLIGIADGVSSTYSPSRR